VVLIVELRVKVGPKGQIVIPKIFRKIYGIKEGGYVVLESADSGLVLRGVESPEKIVEWIRKRRERIGGKEAKLGDLARIDLEED